MGPDIVAIVRRGVRHNPTFLTPGIFRARLYPNGRVWYPNGRVLYPNGPRMAIYPNTTGISLGSDVASTIRFVFLQTL